jgi:hypothetical protein
MFIFLSIFVFILAFILTAFSRFNAFLFLIPLSVYSQSSTVISIGERGVNLGMDTIYIFAILILELIKKEENKFKLNFNKSSIALSLCFGYFFLNSLVSSIMGQKGVTLSGLVVYIRLFQYIPIFILLSNFKIDISQSFKVIKVFIWTGISGTILAVYQFLSGKYTYMKGMPSFTMPIFREADSTAINGLYAGSGNYNVYAAFLIISIFLTFIIWLCRNEEIGLKKRSFLISMIILLIGLYVSSSRAAIIAILIGILSMIFNKEMILYSIRTVFMLIVSIFILGYIFRENPFVHNITAIYLDFNKALPYVMSNTTYNSSMGFSGDTMGAVVRIFGFSEAIRVFLHYPLFGCGFDLFLSQSIHYPENLFLQILAETGIIGFSLYITFIYRLYINAASLPTDSKFNKYYVATFQGIIIAMIFVNMTGATLLIQKVWGPFLLIAGFFYGYQRTTLTKQKLENVGKID